MFLIFRFFTQGNSINYGVFSNHICISMVIVSKIYKFSLLFVRNLCLNTTIILYKGVVVKTVKELLDSYEEAIEKILNSQEYRTGEHNNRYAELKDLEKKQQALISKITDEKDMYLTEWELDLKLRSSSGKARVIF